MPVDWRRFGPGCRVRWCAVGVRLCCQGEEAAEDLEIVVQLRRGVEISSFTTFPLHFSVLFRFCCAGFLRFSFTPFFSFSFLSPCEFFLVFCSVHVCGLCVVALCGVQRRVMSGLSVCLCVWLWLGLVSTWC